MPAQILPILDISEQIQNERSNRLRAQQLELQEAYHNNLSQLQNAKAMAEQAQAPIRAQILQQELQNAQIAGQAAMENLNRTRTEAPIRDKILAEELAGRQDERSDRKTRLELEKSNQTFTQDIAREANARANKQQINLDAEAVLKNQLTDLQIKLGQKELDQSAFDTAAKKAGFVSTFAVLPRDVRATVLTDPSVAKSLDVRTLAYLQALPDPPSEKEKDDSFFRNNLTPGEFADYQRARLDLASLTPNPMDPEATKNERAKLLDSIQFYMTQAYSKRTNAMQNPKTVPMRTGKSGQPVVDQSKLVPGSYYLDPNGNTVIFLRLDDQGNPVWRSL